MSRVSASYNIPIAVRLVGRLDTRALERAFNETVRRHEVLRTILIDEGGIPRQVIAPRLETALSPDDLSGLPEGVRDARHESGFVKNRNGRSTWRGDRSSGPLCCGWPSKSTSSSS